MFISRLQDFFTTNKREEHLDQEVSEIFGDIYSLFDQERHVTTLREKQRLEDRMESVRMKIFSQGKKWRMERRKEDFSSIHQELSAAYEQMKSHVERMLFQKKLERRAFEKVREESGEVSSLFREIYSLLEAVEEVRDLEDKKRLESRLEEAQRKIAFVEGILRSKTSKEDIDYIKRDLDAVFAKVSFQVKLTLATKSLKGSFLQEKKDAQRNIPYPTTPFVTAFQRKGEKEKKEKDLLEEQELSISKMKFLSSVYSLQAEIRRLNKEGEERQHLYPHKFSSKITKPLEIKTEYREESTMLRQAPEESCAERFQGELERPASPETPENFREEKERVLFPSRPVFAGGAIRNPFSIWEESRSEAISEVHEKIESFRKNLKSIEESLQNKSFSMDFFSLKSRISFLQEEVRELRDHIYKKVRKASAAREMKETLEALLTRCSVMESETEAKRLSDDPQMESLIHEIFNANRIFGEELASKGLVSISRKDPLLKGKNLPFSLEIFWKNGRLEAYAKNHGDFFAVLGKGSRKQAKSRIPLRKDIPGLVAITVLEDARYCISAEEIIGPIRKIDQIKSKYLSRPIIAFSRSQTLDESQKSIRQVSRPKVYDVEGCELYKAMKKKKLNMVQENKIMLETAKGVKHLHMPKMRKEENSSHHRSGEGKVADACFRKEFLFPTREKGDGCFMGRRLFAPKPPLSSAAIILDSMRRFKEKKTTVLESLLKKKNEELHPESELKPMAHLDIKPENIILYGAFGKGVEGTDFSVKISDCDTLHDASEWDFFPKCGTPEFLAPEAAKVMIGGENEKMDLQRLDIFSLACCMLEIISEGRIPDFLGDLRKFRSHRSFYRKRGELTLDDIRLSRSHPEFGKFEWKTGRNLESYEEVRRRQRARLSGENLVRRLRYELVADMLHPDPNLRPDILEVCRKLSAMQRIS